MRFWASLALNTIWRKEVFELSGGMKRRLEFARAIIGWPPIMLLDEPTSGLDPINAQQVRDMIIRAREFHQMSSLYVSKVMHARLSTWRRATHGRTKPETSSCEKPAPTTGQRHALWF